MGGLRGMRVAMMQIYYKQSVSHWAIVVWSIIQDAYFGYYMDEKGSWGCKGNEPAIMQTYKETICITLGHSSLPLNG